MTTTRTFLLSNISHGTYIDLTVVDGQDVLTSAQSYLADTGLPEEVRHGFFVSVFPTASEESSPVQPVVTEPVAVESVAVEPEAGTVEGPGIQGVESSPSAPTVGSSPLSAAAAQGPLHWTDDPEVDPPGTPEPLRANSDQLKSVYVGVPIAGAGGH
ncbi:hypothetical protein ABIB25_004828 [Nakamurella sp. UYEF19]|uniref:hypothetical protein n=1 Tax=Nakamurella sp. UYEF19 TaxID=1756392 RepID=UPI00339629C4